MNVLTVLFSAATFAATLRMAVPLLFVALGGVLTKRAGIENIGLEGLMLIGCFSGFAANYFTSSWIVGSSDLIPAPFDVWRQGLFCGRTRAHNPEYLAPRH